MPLVKAKSNAARQANIAREVSAGKPPAQAVAIAYSVQRQAAGGNKGRATQQHRRGTMTSGRKARTHAEADRALGHSFHSHKGN